MNTEILQMAWQALLGNKVRSLLSMLGIIIGVATVIAVVGIGLGAQKKVQEQFKNLSVNTLVVVPSRGGAASSKLDAADLPEILAQATLIQKGTASIQGNAEVSANGESGSYTIQGIFPNFFEYSNLTFAAGETFTQEDLDKRNRSVIIGDELAQNLFGEDYVPTEIIGSVITVARKKMNVIGVLEFNGGSGRLSYDDDVFLPYDTAQRNVLGVRASNRLLVDAYSFNEIELAEEEITEILRTKHRIREGKENDFRIFNAGSLVSSAQESSETLTFLLTAVSAIVLIVSGIGIMNVMFVTVAERTREIGILKALGAKQKDILTQFLLEAIILSMIGGIVGIMAGNGIIPLLDKFEAMYSISAVILGFSFSVLVGVFFGFYPAYKASRLDPVDALRSE